MANHHLTLNQPAEGVTFYKISNILEKGTPQSCMEVVGTVQTRQKIKIFFVLSNMSDTRFLKWVGQMNRDILLRVHQNLI